MSDTSDSLPGTYAEVSPLYVQAGFNPIPVIGKKNIPVGATGYQGKVTPESIAEWSSDPKWADKNVAIVGNGWIGIDVDAYDEKTGDAQLRELEGALGELPATPSSTSRGAGQPSRIYFFEVDKDAHFLDHAAPDIEVIQASHRYAVVAPSFHPETGAQYTWYDAEGDEMGGIPNVADFERLPEAWFEYLYTDPQAPTQGFSGTVEEWLNKLNPAGPNSRVNAWIASIPTENFDHTDVVKITYNIVRLGAEGEPGIREALTHLYNTWVKPPYDTPLKVKELSVAIQGAIRKAGSLEITPESLPHFFQAMASVPNVTPELEKMIFHGDDVETLANQLFTLGLDIRDSASIAWKGAGQKAGMEFGAFWETMTGLLRKFREAKPEQQQADGSISLLTSKEREIVNSAENWMTRYMRYAYSQVPDGYLNEPYHRLAGWVVASMTYGVKGRLERYPRPMPTNVYGTGLGPSSTGKTDAEKVGMGAIKAFFKDDHGWDMGSNASAASMQRHLIEQDKRATMFHDDEASGPLGSFKEQKGFQDLPMRITKWHDGEVSPMFRTVDREINGKSAEAHLCMWMYGTPIEVFKVVEKDDFTSGFLARMIWYVGEPAKSETPEYNIKWRDDEATELGYDPLTEDLAGHLHAVSERLDFLFNSAGYVPVRPNAEANARVKKAGNKILGIFKNHKNQAALDPSLKRMMDVIWKFAALLALEDTRQTITIEDVLYAIREAEFLIPALELVTDNLANSYHSRSSSDLLMWLANIKKNDIPIHVVYQYLEHMDTYQADRLINSLVAQKKITKKTEPGGAIFLNVTKGGAGNE